MARRSRVHAEQELSEEQKVMQEQWEKERVDVRVVQDIKEKLDKLRTEIDKAEAGYDLQKVSHQHPPALLLGLDALLCAERSARVRRRGHRLRGTALARVARAAAVSAHARERNQRLTGAAERQAAELRYSKLPAL